MKGGTILLVEDDPDDEVLILRTLKKANLANDVVVTWDGPEALDCLFGTGAYEGRGPLKPTVVLLDIKMPKIDGLEVLRRLRRDERTKRLPVVILTSSDRQQDIYRTYELGANSYITKPVEFDEFTKAVRQLGLYWMLLNEPPPDTGTA